MLREDLTGRMSYRKAWRWWRGEPCILWEALQAEGRGDEHPCGRSVPSLGERNSKEASVVEAESVREGENNGRWCQEGKRSRSHGALQAVGSEREATGELCKGMAWSGLGLHRIIEVTSLRIGWWGKKPEAGDWLGTYWDWQDDQKWLDSVYTQKVKQ